MALAAVLRLHRLQAGVVAAGEVEVGLCGDVGEAVVPAEAAAVPGGEISPLAGGLGDQAAVQRAARVQPDQAPELVRDRGAPEGGVAGGAECLAGGRQLAFGVDLGQALGAVLSHPAYIGSGDVNPERLLDAWSAEDREAPGGA